MKLDDGQLFAPRRISDLCSATRDLSWLLGRGYSTTAALKLVGDRHDLDARQRKAVSRCACGDEARDSRLDRRIAIAEIAGRHLLLDGFNCLITLQTAMSGGLVLRGRDRCYRDLASVHGAYRPGRATAPAIRAIGALLGPTEAVWYLDRPVSGSGELRRALLEHAAEAGWPWTVELVPDPDVVLVEAGQATVVATSDSAILDGCATWVDLLGAVITMEAPGAWVVDLGV